MLSKELEFCFNKAVKRANELSHEYLTCELILWALLIRDEVRDVLVRLHVDIDAFQRDLEEMLANQSGYSILTDEQKEKLSLKQFADPKFREIAKRDGIIFQPELSLAVQTALQNSAIQVQSSGLKTISPLTFLVSLYASDNKRVNYLFKKYGIERLDLVEAVSHGGQEEVAGVGSTKPAKSSIEQYAINLTQKAKEGKIDPLIGRTNEVRAISRVLCRRTKNNPLLVGDSGVGKTAIVEGLAKLIFEEKVPEPILGATVYALDLTSMLSGAKYRGDFEKRFKSLIDELVELNKQGKKPILIIDELHTIMGAGSVSGSAMDAASLLKPALVSSDIRCIGSTTHEEYRKHIERDKGFGRRFQIIEIDELSINETLEVLKGVRELYEKYHKVTYNDFVLKSIVDLSAKYLSEKRFPDKALDIIDELGAQKNIEGRDVPRDISVNDVEKLISILAKVPVVASEVKDHRSLLDLPKQLKSIIFGQNHAIESVTDVIMIAQSGLKSSEGPIGSFLFTGPTGVGKTELAKQLANFLNVHFERFDMSEYMEKHSVAKMIGAPPGYVGHEGGGILTDMIKKHPNSVLLLDEIEKAHPDVINILLQIMDHGALTDSHGRTTNFKNSIIIMTSNIGAKEMESGSIGLYQQGVVDISSKGQNAIKNFFTPEFRNRLDGIVQFNRLAHDQLVLVVEKFLKELELLLVKQGFLISFSQEIKDWVIKHGYSYQLGARPLARLINSDIKKPLSKELLQAKIEKGSTITVSVVEDRPYFQFSN